MSNIYVTRPFLPPLDEFKPYLDAIWESGVLTNGGQYHKKLEEELCRYLGVKYISLFSNATIALITALQALKINGEVITTPFSFVATSHALRWNNIEPIFVDIEPEYLNIDPARIEEAITSNTKAIMPVHCYGNPCYIDKIEQIAQHYQLKVIYDAAHAFGVKKNGSSILNYGDLSIISFHATKVFNTFEGGAIVCPNLEIKNRIDRLKNFGFEDEVTVNSVGINGKMSEIHAAFGLLQLNYIDQAISERKKIDTFYRQRLSSCSGITLLKIPHSTTLNYSYFPILVNEEYPLSRDNLYLKLKQSNIFSRRYFYPLISQFPMYKNSPSAKQDNLPIATKIGKQILCLPIYPGLTESDQIKICDLILNG